MSTKGMKLLVGRIADVNSVRYYRGYMYVDGKENVTKAVSRETRNGAVWSYPLGSVSFWID